MRKRAEIREKIDRGDGKEDRIGTQLLEASNVIERLLRASVKVLSIAMDGEPNHEHADLVRVWKIVESVLGEDIPHDVDLLLRPTDSRSVTVHAEHVGRAVPPIWGDTFDSGLSEEEREEQERWQQASGEAFWRVEEEIAQVSDEMTEDGLTGRAVELADMVSDVIWGGERGWERADNEQFKLLLQKARAKLRSDA